MSVKPKSVAQYMESGCGRCKFGGTPQCKVMSWVEELRLFRRIIQEPGLTEKNKVARPLYAQ